MFLPTLLTLVLVATTAADNCNIAQNKPAFQSSTATLTGWWASRGVDGNKEAKWDGIGCSSTGNDQEAWWAVDLGAPYFVSTVSIKNREDCCSERLSNFQIGLTTISPKTKAPVVGQYEACATQGPALGAGETKSFDCPSYGRYLVVQLKGKNYLTLCEVEVFGEVAVNHALNKPAFQSSKYKEEGIPSRVVDGNRNGDFNGKSCTHTHSEQGAWWAVDLGAEYQVDRVAITNRADSSTERLANFQIGLTNTSPVTKAPVVGDYDVCATQGPALGAGETKLFACPSYGRYVVVQLKGKNFLTLCEVEVYGTIVTQQ